MDDYNKEHRQTLVRNQLNADKIKLWLPPYTTETDEKGLVPQVNIIGLLFSFTAKYLKFLIC